MHADTRSVGSVSRQGRSSKMVNMEITVHSSSLPVAHFSLSRFVSLLPLVQSFFPLLRLLCSSLFLHLFFLHLFSLVSICLSRPQTLFSDLATVRQKITLGHYTSATEMLEDLRLTFDNAKVLAGVRRYAIDFALSVSHVPSTRFHRYTHLFCAPHLYTRFIILIFADLLNHFMILL